MTIMLRDFEVVKYFTPLLEPYLVTLEVGGFHGVLAGSNARQQEYSPRALPV